MNRINKIWLVSIFANLIMFIIFMNYLGITINDFLKLSKITTLMRIPNIAYISELIEPTIQTIAIAYVGTILGIIFSIILGILASRNMTINRIVYEISRVIIMIARVIPDIVWAFLLIPAVGLGAAQGIFAIAIHSTGMIGRFFAESIEEIDPKPLEALETCGATYFQKLIYGVFPQVMPSFVNYVMYAFDHNIRVAIILGMFGVGGLGFQFIIKFRVFEYDNVFAILLLIFIILLGVEKISSYIRKKILVEN
ncbi:phosphonate ABC transporter, permease protein PhnE [Methanocaldococcus infernus]|uniref:Phosphonate ABC transporter, inner membrane subunit n=1 Tax=Methanocaldococcus infernus (strain DSM 11812 / JCM 15783 / ME) TaxID=573063 RepID=D5VQX2_METIM|nr:phosphonate ABC transporter, permease protein PhnE [Methanocaldococcus infernus]ADG12975.1 phosphonate ABC transporter, inner membrane subunit [Methanocaldococcus infernus ME]